MRPNGRLANRLLAMRGAIVSVTDDEPPRSVGRAGLVGEPSNMTDDGLDISRRQALAALGSIGVASAGAGLGTSAFFSDQESFANNRLTAGSLDLKMDWEEHYSDWSADEDDDPEGGTLDIRMEEPEEPDAYRRYPAGSTDETVGESPVWVLEEDVPQFMDNTAIDALPDTDNNGTAEFPLDEMFIDGEGPCEYLADVGDDDDGLSSDLRTTNDVTSPGDPVVSLDDVKPGDFGEVTFSAHLCGNPGYLWLNMPGGLTESENGVTEPEADDEDEDDSPGDTETSGELGETVQTALWYDADCDNLPDEGANPVDLLVLADLSSSIDSGEMATFESAAETFAGELPQDGTVEAGLISFAGPGEGDQFQGVTLQEPIGSLDQFKDSSGAYEFDPYFPESGDGSTPIPAALEIGQSYLDDAARPNADQVILLVTDGGPDYPNSSNSPFTPYELTDTSGNSITGPNAPYTSDPEDGANDSISSIAEQDETKAVATNVKNAGVTLATVALDFADNPAFEGAGGTPQQALKTFLIDLATPGFFADGIENTATVAAENIAIKISALAGGGDGSATAEPYIFRGTLAELEAVLTADDGLGVPLDANPTTEARDCFAPGVTYCFGFSWWVPLNHGNEIQSDSAEFDIGFYTEQCRHNDGEGMANRPDA